MIRDRLTPEAQHQAAETLGRADADGLLPPGEAARTLRVIVNEAYAAAPGVDRSGLRARLVWAARDAKHARAHQIANTETAIRWAVRPLIQEKRSPADILDAARRASGGVLGDEKLRPILADEWDRAHKRGRK